MVLRREAVDAVDGGDVLLRLERVTQRLAELRRARLGLLLGHRHDPLQDKGGVIAVRAEHHRRFVAELVAVVLDEGLHHLLGGMRIRQLPRHQDRPDRQDRLLGRLACDPQEIARARAVRLVDLPLVAAIGQRRLRQGCTGARAGDQDRFRIGRHQLEHLPGHAGVGAAVLLVGDDLRPGPFEPLRKGLVPLLAPRIGEADHAKRLELLRLDVLDDRIRHQLHRLRHDERPGGLVACKRNRREGHVHRLRLVGHGRHRHAARRLGGAQHHVDLFLGRELAGVARGLGRVAGIVEDDEPDFLAADLGRPEVEAVLHRDAERRARTGQRERDADGEVRSRRCGEGEGDGQGQAQARQSLHGNRFHALSPSVLHCLRIRMCCFSDWWCCFWKWSPGGRRSHRLRPAARGMPGRPHRRARRDE